MEAGLCDNAVMVLMFRLCLQARDLVAGLVLAVDTAQSNTWSPQSAGTVTHPSLHLRRHGGQGSWCDPGHTVVWVESNGRWVQIF